MPRIQMETLEGHFLRRMMIGPKCNFIRVYDLSINEAPPHPSFILAAAIISCTATLFRKSACLLCKLPWLNELFVMLC